MGEAIQKLIESRIIWLGEEITEHTANRLVTELLYLDSLSDDPIKLFINSPGGDVLSSWAIIDTMSILDAPVDTYVIGKAYSAAAYVLVAGRERYATKHSMIMFHNIWIGGTFTSEELADTVKRIQRLSKDYYELLKRKTKLSPKKFERRDLYLTPAEAKKLDVITEVLGDN